MKILQIGLLAFGPFRDIILDLDEGHEGMHIIYGPNEAGKTSALRALRCLLYGIPERSPDAFVHPYSKLRIAGRLRRDDGTVLEFVRRKGRINTIRAPDDTTPIDDSYLKRFLGNVDADLFARMFGIDHTDLVRGGREIIQGGGDVGRLLFAAGSGISDLKRVQDGLQAEAEAIFRPRGQTQEINAALARFRENKKALREAELPGQDWARHDRALREAINLKKSVEKELEQRQRDLSRLERVRDALPAIARRKGLLNELKTCVDAVLLPTDFGDRREKALTELKIAENREAQARQDLRDVKEALGGLDIPEAVIESAGLIEQLHQDLGSHRKAMKDRSRLVVQEEGLEAEAGAILRELRNDLTLDQVEQLRLGRAETVRIQELGSIHEGLAATLEGIKKEIHRYSLQRDQLERHLAGLETPRDTMELQRAIKRVRQYGPLEEEYQAECRRIGEAEQAARLSLKRQDLWAGEIEDLEALAIPPLETIDLFEGRLDERLVTGQWSEIHGLEGQIVDLEGQLRQLSLEQDVPTEEELFDARRRRDQGWLFVRRAWEEGSLPGRGEEDFIAAFSPADCLAGAYELSVRQADGLADRLRREADRIAKKAQLLSNIETCKNRYRHLKDLIETEEARLKEAKREWTELWKATGILPRSPREMRAWAQDQMAIVRQISAIREHRARAEELKARIEMHRQELGRCLGSLGRPCTGDESLAHLIERGQGLVDQIEEVQSERNRVLLDLEKCREGLRDAESRARETEQGLLDWQSNWAEAIRPLGLGADASPAQANAVLEDLKDLFGKVKEARVLRRRIEGIDRDAGEFSKKITELARNEAPELLRVSPEQAVLELTARLTRARKAEAQQQALRERQRQQEKGLLAARARIVEIQAQLATMCEEAGCKDYRDLPAAEERSAHRRQVQADLKQVEGQICRLSAGATLEEFIEDAQTIDPDGIDAAIERFTQEIRELVRRKSEIDQTIGSEKTELSKMDGSARAADLAEERQGLLAYIEGRTEEYVRLRLASMVLSQAIETYREKSQGPVLKRSSELFRSMTVGSFDGIRLDVDEKGGALLVGIRPGGRDTVGVEGMSDGTVDQLYLAVRLASLETYLGKNEAMPLILDDILINFDDERSIATLQILAQLAVRTQVIFFTHHRHLVELAKAHIDAEILFRHSLFKSEVS